MRLLILFTLSISMILGSELTKDYNSQTCEASYSNLFIQVTQIPKRQDVTPKIFSQKIFDCVRSVPNVLDDCNLPLVQQQFNYYLPKACINQLQDLTTLLDQYDRATNNITKALYLSQLTARFVTTLPLKCPHIYEFIKDFINRTLVQQSSGQITQDCGQALYKYSLLIQKIFVDITKHKQQLAKDIQNAIVGLPDTLDYCGQNDLANIIRNSFPKQCLDSIVNLQHIIEQFMFNHSHWQWMFTHRKELFGAFRQIRYTCPAF